MSKIARKYLAHYLDANFGTGTPNYTRLGKDLDELNEDLNPEIETGRNILGESTVQHNGYEVQSEVDPFYADPDDPFYEPIAEIANERKTGAACETTKVDVLYNEDGSVVWAYKEDVVVVPNSIGGDTSGIQIPFTIYNRGNRVKGTFSNGTFTANSGSESGS